VIPPYNLPRSRKREKGGGGEREDRCRVWHKRAWARLLITRACIRKGRKRAGWPRNISASALTQRSEKEKKRKHRGETQSCSGRYRRKEKGRRKRKENEEKRRLSFYNGELEKKTASPSRSYRHAEEGGGKGKEGRMCFPSLSLMVLKSSKIGREREKGEASTIQLSRQSGRRGGGEG